ncbi:hypothetical protein B0H13DRAFT_2479048 [Mycena leptocephala]|nr:hypothetical protein B0H13DRAFT_2479048 [Mycena leptocephala]
MRAALTLCFLAVLQLAGAVPTNHTVDDANPQMAYASQNDTGAVGYGRPSGLINGADSADPEMVVLWKFVGSAVYIYFAAPINTVEYDQTAQFIVDGDQETGVTVTTPPTTTGDYNILVFSMTGMANEGHVITISHGPFAFDYLIYTSDDPETSSTETSTSTTNAVLPMSLTITSASPTIQPTTEAPRGISSSSTQTALSVSTAEATVLPPQIIAGSKSHSAAIAGGVIGGVVLMAVLILALFVCRRRRPTKDSDSSARTAKEMPAVTPDSTPLSFDAHSLYTGRAAANGVSESGRPPLEDQVRRLQEEVELLKLMQVGVRSSVGSGSVGDVAVLTRSLSTMKSAQTHAVMSHYSHGQASVRDSFSQTEGGLRLTAEADGRNENAPPTYE